jgi:thiol-disulfide isomerase/thioredoxin
MLLVSCAIVARLSGQARPGSDPRQEIRAALAAAQKDGKPVVLDFGADWCVDCRVLWKLLEEQELAAFVRENFHWVEIDVGEYFVGPESPKARNLDVAAKYGVDLMKEGVPALVILSSAGVVVPVRHQIDWSRARGFSANEVLSI